MSAPEQSPYGQMPPTSQPYGTMPPAYAQPYGPTRAPVDLGDMLRRRILIVLVCIGLLLLLIGRLVQVYMNTSADAQKAAVLVSTLGGLMIAALALTWGLGSKRTTDWQNLGLLLLAAWLIVVFGAL